MRRALLAAGVSLALSSVVLVAQTSPAANVMPGTWKLDVAKSKYSPGPAPKSQTATLTAVEGGIRTTADRVEADGKTVHFVWTGTFDGKDNPVTGDPSRDAVSVRRPDAYTLDITNKKAGKVTTTIHAVYAKDGKSRTETVTGTNTQGQQVNNVTVWTKS